jgi:hypothetical protein
MTTDSAAAKRIRSSTAMRSWLRSPPPRLGVLAAANPILVFYSFPLTLRLGRLHWPHVDEDEQVVWHFPQASQRFELIGWGEELVVSVETPMHQFQ